MGSRLLPAAAVALAAGCGQPAATGPSGIQAGTRVVEALPAEVRAALEEGEVVQLLSLFPQPRALDPALWEERGYDEGETVDDYAVLGRLRLRGADRARAVQALYDGIEASDGTVAACFDPRHAFAAAHGDREVQVVVCYECLSLQLWVDGDHVGGATTTEAPGEILTAMLRAGEVPLPDR